MTHVQQPINPPKWTKSGALLSTFLEADSEKFCAQSTHQRKFKIQTKFCVFLSTKQPTMLQLFPCNKFDEISTQHVNQWHDQSFQNKIVCLSCL